MTAIVRTYTGRMVDLENLHPDDVDILDIAFGLSRHPRWAGQTRDGVDASVAEHSVLVASLLPPDLEIAGLLHDASEAYMGDVVTPLKRRLGGYREIESVVMSAVAVRFGFVWPLDPKVKRADEWAAAWEGRDWMDPPLDVGFELPQQAHGRKLARPMGLGQFARIRFLTAFGQAANRTLRSYG